MKIDETILASLPYEEAKKLARSFMLQKRIGQLAEGKNAGCALSTMTASCSTPSTPTELSQAGLATSAPTWPSASYPCAIRQRVQTAVPTCTRLHTGRCGPVPPVAVSGWFPSSDRRRCIRQGRTGRRHPPDERRHGRDRQAKRENHDLRTLLRRWRHPLGKSLIGATGRKACGNASTGEPRLRDFGPAGEEHSKEQGYLLGLDKRQLPIRSDHAALNVLLQSAGALLSKKWVELIDAELTKQNLDARIIAWVHDEVIETKETRSMSVESLEEWRKKLAERSASQSPSKPASEQTGRDPLRGGIRRSDAGVPCLGAVPLRRSPLRATSLGWRQTKSASAQVRG